MCNCYVETVMSAKTKLRSDGGAGVAVEDGPPRFDPPKFEPGKPTAREILKMLAAAPASEEKARSNNEILDRQKRTLIESFIRPHDDRRNSPEARAAIAAHEARYLRFDARARRDAIAPLARHAPRIDAELREVRRAIVPLMQFLAQGALDPRSFLELKRLRGLECDCRRAKERLATVSLELRGATLLPNGYQARLELVRQGAEAAQVLANDAYGRGNAGTVRALQKQLEDRLRRMTEAVTTHTWEGLEKLRDEPIGN